jgi:ornithine cyclodeaminase
VIVLFNPETGEPRAFISGNRLTALRTAAAAAISARALARPDARVLGIIGAGKQALGHARALIKALPIRQIIIANRTEESAEALTQRLSAEGHPAEAASVEALCRRADVIVSVTSSRIPLVKAAWVKPGTHIAAMGADTVGKQELDVSLLASARVFTDEIEQAISLGEAQHAARCGAITARNLTTLSEVLIGGAKGRSSHTEITIFDGTGVAVQDLAVAGLALQRAIERGLTQEITI